MKNTKEELERIIGNLTSELKGMNCHGEDEIKKKYEAVWDLRVEYKRELSELEASENLKRMMDISDEILEIIDDADKVTRGDLQARVEALVRINFIK